MGKLRVILAVAVCLSLAGVAQALPRVDAQEAGSNVLTEGTPFDTFEPGDGVTTAVSKVLAGGETLTITPMHAPTSSGVGTPEFQDRNRNSKIATQGSTSSRADGLYDNARVSIIGGWNDITKVPRMQIEFAGLAPVTAYGVRIGAYNVYNVLTHQIITPTAGTTGPTATLVHGLPIPMGTYDQSVADVWTTSPIGTLTLNYDWDVARWAAYAAGMPGGTYQSETTAQLGYIELLPEPATMSMLALGALALIRKRR